MYMNFYRRISNNSLLVTTNLMKNKLEKNVSLNFQYDLLNRNSYSIMLYTIVKPRILDFRMTFYFPVAKTEPEICMCLKSEYSIRIQLPFLCLGQGHVILMPRSMNRDPWFFCILSTNYALPSTRWLLPTCLIWCTTQSPPEGPTYTSLIKIGQYHWAGNEVVPSFLSLMFKGVNTGFVFVP